MAKRTLIAAAFLLSLPAGCATKPSKPGGSFDVGPVFASRTPTIAHQFQVKNTTGSTVRILGENHSCTCTDVTITKATLPPGASTPLTLKLPTPDNYSKVTVSCVIVTDSKNYPEWVYELSYESFPNGVIRPDRIDLGSHDMGATTGAATPFVVETFSREDQKPPELGRINAPAALSINADGEPIVDSPSGGIRRVTHRMTVGLKGGPREPGAFALPFDMSLAGSMGVSAMATWRVVGSTEAVPSHIFFGSMTLGDSPVNKRSVVRSIDGKPFRILGIDTGSGDVRVLAPPEPNQGKEVASEHVIEVALMSPARFQRVMSGTVTVSTQSGEGRRDEVKIPWSAFFRQRSD